MQLACLVERLLALACFAWLVCWFVGLLVGWFNQPTNLGASLHSLRGRLRSTSRIRPRCGRSRRRGCHRHSAPTRAPIPRNCVGFVGCRHSKVQRGSSTGADVCSMSGCFVRAGACLLGGWYNRTCGRLNVGRMRICWLCWLSYGQPCKQVTSIYLPVRALSLPGLAPQRSRPTACSAPACGASLTL